MHDLKKGVNGYNYAQSSSDADFFPNINKLIKAKYQTIFAIGYKLDNAVSQSAKNNPNVNFAIIDSNVKNRKNVASVNFKTEQSSFLAG
ncbi:BMP family lipoprotein, partial [Staphylococcus epidermidis]|uniref:BMP family lipoprotein n=1 Tax=Staphylococcus epidermidis TaxID=1282 RepID=UPI003C7A3DA5